MLRKGGKFLDCFIFPNNKHDSRIHYYTIRRANNVKGKEVNRELGCSNELRTALQSKCFYVLHR